MNKKILIISTGGTISQIHTEKGIAISNEKSFKGDTFSDILNNFKEKLSIDVIDSKTILNKDSSNIVPEDWKKIIDTIVEEYDNYSYTWYKYYGIYLFSCFFCYRKLRKTYYFYWFTGILWNDRNRCNNEFRECAKNYSR